MVVVSTTGRVGRSSYQEVLREHWTVSSRDPSVNGVVLHVDAAGLLAVARLIGDGLRDVGREVGRVPGLLVRRH
ncbi:hypothetical protein EDD33_3905 [Nocardioides aurantiacus]|uniref:Uncharacterized protein n=1 Tax=Nocardioides aurantiacus TaxID=86796 RepID=A0A3N2CZQ3_9ACTN|nr:hypothetical protein EDD33_3905 [Nocardioides aurantiacus]